MEPCFLTAAAAAALLKERKLSCEELARSCLGRMQEREPQVRAWLHVDAEAAIRNAREMDKAGPRGVLHGLPLGVKDVIDTIDFPTTQNSPIYAGTQVGRDAACVAVARGSGALIMGKTDTVEFASGGRKALSRNPFNLEHTPGGTSSGSAAAVGDFMVPLAFGTQTAGSLIRPAAFNGIYAMKPSWSLVSREGVRMSCPSLDTVGWYGRSVEDLELVALAFRFHKSGPALEAKRLRVAVCRSPAWSEIEPAGATNLEQTAARLSREGMAIQEFDLPGEFSGLLEAQAAIIQREGGTSFLPEYINAPHLLARDIKDKVENAAGITDEALLNAYALADRCRTIFDRFFPASFDVLLTPSAPGEAPRGLHGTGNAIFNRIWTLLHAPCVSIPTAKGPGGLPLGIQLVGPRLGDSRLLGMASALAPLLDDWTPRLPKQ